jgi:acyl carrier protein
MNDLLSRVSTLLTTRFGVATEELRADAKLTDLDLDSLSLVELGLVAEKEFGVRLGEDEIAPEDTVADLVQLIAGKGVAA